MMEVELSMLFEFTKMILKSPLFHLLLATIVLDVITGFIKAFINRKVNSKISSVGMMKHFVVVAMVITVGTFSMIFDVRPFSYMFCTYYICSYGISLAENYEAIGLPFPASLKPFFQQMRENADENIVGHIKVDKMEVKQVDTNE